MAAKKRKSAIEARVGHSYGDLSGYGFGLNNSESVEVSKQLNRRGVPTNDLAVSRDYLISVNERATGSYKKNKRKK
jgi:hypothetical protein